MDMWDIMFMTDAQGFIVYSSLLQWCPSNVINLLLVITENLPWYWPIMVSHMFCVCVGSKFDLLVAFYVIVFYWISFCPDMIDNWLYNNLYKIYM